MEDRPDDKSLFLSWEENEVRKLTAFADEWREALNEEWAGKANKQDYLNSLKGVHASRNIVQQAHSEVQLALDERNDGTVITRRKAQEAVSRLLAARQNLLQQLKHLKAAQEAADNDSVDKSSLQSRVHTAELVQREEAAILELRQEQASNVQRGSPQTPPIISPDVARPAIRAATKSVMQCGGKKVQSLASQEGTLREQHALHASHHSQGTVAPGAPQTNNTQSSDSFESLEARIENAPAAMRNYMEAALRYRDSLNDVEQARLTVLLHALLDEHGMYEDGWRNEHWPQHLLAEARLKEDWEMFLEALHSNFAVPQELKDDYDMLYERILAIFEHSDEAIGPPRGRSAFKFTRQAFCATRSEVLEGERELLQYVWNGKVAAILANDGLTDRDEVVRLAERLRQHDFDRLESDLSPRWPQDGILRIPSSARCSEENSEIDEIEVAKRLGFADSSLGFGENWNYHSYLGDGSFGRAVLWVKYDANHSITDRMVVKEIFLGSRWDNRGVWYGSPDDRIPKEAGIHNSIPSNKHIVRLQGRGVYPELRMIRIYQEYCAHGDLYNVLANHFTMQETAARAEDGSQLDFPIPAVALWYFFQGLAAAACMLRYGKLPDEESRDALESAIVHRDIRPGNVFLAEPSNNGTSWPGIPVVKLGDFGLAEMNPTGTVISHISPPRRGPMGAMAPEEARARPEAWRLNQHDTGSYTNIWQVGYTMMCLMDLKRQRVSDQIHFGDEVSVPALSEETANYYPEALVGLVQQCVQELPEERIDARELYRKILNTVKAYPEVQLDDAVPIQFRRYLMGRASDSRGTNMPIGQGERCARAQFRSIDAPTLHLPVYVGRP